MNLLIFSDIHGDTAALEKLVSREADYYIAAGDLVNWGRGLDRIGSILALSACMFCLETTSQNPISLSCAKASACTIFMAALLKLADTTSQASAIRIQPRLIPQVNTAKKSSRNGFQNLPV